MNKELSNSAQRVQTFLIEIGYNCIVKELPDTLREALRKRLMPLAVFQLNSNELEKMSDGKFIDLKLDDGKNFTSCFFLPVFLK